LDWLKQLPRNHAWAPRADSNKTPGDYWLVMFARVGSYAVGLPLVFAAVVVMPGGESCVRRAGERTLGAFHRNKHQLHRHRTVSDTNS
jgi:hypothetical protein